MCSQAPNPWLQFHISNCLVGNPQTSKSSTFKNNRYSSLKPVFSVWVDGVIDPATVQAKSHSRLLSPYEPSHPVTKSSLICLDSFILLSDSKLLSSMKFSSSLSQTMIIISQLRPPLSDLSHVSPSATSCLTNPFTMKNLIVLFHCLKAFSGSPLFAPAEAQIQLSTGARQVSQLSKGGWV